MAVYKNKQGLYSIRFKYKDNNNVWKQKMAHSGKSGFVRKKDALKREKEIVQEIEDSLLRQRDKSRKTFKDVMEEKLIDCKFYMKETSIKATRQSLNHAESIFNCPIDEVTTQQLRQIIYDLVKKDLSVGTIDKIYYKINLVFKHALENNYITKNPLTNVKRPKNPNEVKESKSQAWTYAQFQEFIQNVHDPMYYTLFSLLYYTGMRRGEATGLQWVDVDLEKGTIYIKQTLSNIHSVKEAVLTPPKTKNSIRLIHIPQVLLDILREWYKSESKKYYFNKKAFVFGNIYPLARNTVYNQFRKHIRIGTKGYGYTDKGSLEGNLEVDEIVMLKGKVYYNENKFGGYKEFHIHVQIIDIISNPNGLNYVVRIALPYIRPHDLRHSCISLMLNNIKTQKSLIAMAHHFGHDVETMLKTYAHFFMETEQALIQEFDEVIDKENTSNQLLI